MKEENPEKDDGLKELVDRLVKEALHKGILLFLFIFLSACPHSQILYLERLKSLEQDVKRHDEVDQS